MSAATVTVPRVKKIRFLFTGTGILAIAGMLFLSGHLFEEALERDSQIQGTSDETIRRQLIWTPTDDHIGTHEIEVVATDSAGLETRQPITLTVNPAPSPSPTPTPLPAAIIRAVPRTEALEVGDEFEVDFVLDAPEHEISAVSVQGTYSDKIELLSVTDEGSVFETRLDESLTPHTTFALSRSVRATAFQGTGGVIATGRFKALYPGKANVLINKRKSRTLTFNDDIHNLLEATSAGVVQIGGIASDTHLCVRAPLENGSRRTTRHRNTNVSITVVDGTSGEALVTAAGTTNRAGEFTISDQALLEPLTTHDEYRVVVKPTGYISESLATTLALTRRACLTFPPATFGDLSGDDRLTNRDRNLAGNTYRQAGEQQKLRTGSDEPMTLTDLVQVYRNVQDALN